MASLNQALEQALAEIGIDGNRARFYLAALELGEAPIAAVSHQAGIGGRTRMKSSSG
jgi:sugar-specific transcriptional regulator TrmB